MANSRLMALARANSFERESTGIHYRVARARQLQKARVLDSNKSWGLSFHASLKSTNKALGVNLRLLIKKTVPYGNILEIGCGSGRTVTELQTKVPTAHFFALGVRNMKSVWSQYQNSNEINWCVGHANKLPQRLKDKKFDLIFSTYGLIHSVNLKEALSQLTHQIRPGGLLVFNVDEGCVAQVESIIAETNFSILSKKQTIAPDDPFISNSSASRPAITTSFILKTKN